MKAISDKKLTRAAIYSLSFLWIFTGLTSLFFKPGIGYEILANAGITDTLANIAVVGGGALDIALGVWLLTSFKTKLCFTVQLSVIATYTLLLTIIDASFWLHPFGPLTKNIPIVVLILFLINQTETKKNKRKMLT